jgi:hypothetical protein
MNAHAEARGQHDRIVRAWLLALLRFAVTRDTDDRLAVLAAASEIDRLSASQGGRYNFRFFHRTSAGLCGAITEPHPDNIAVLRRHLDRMTDERMRRAFAAAVELDQAREPAKRRPSPRSRRGLWQGLTGTPRTRKIIT